ncbi:MAG: flagellar hook-basal body protein [Lachnoclostridium sp.]|nr:flagellar hook-basal body protein [Lachnoclostridium sp.]
MVRGLYTAYTGMKNEQRRLDVISNNLANSATIGFKKESVTSQAFDQLLTIKIRDGSQAYHNEAIGRMSLGVKIGEVYTNYGQGSLRQTENPFDMAISGEGFFQIKYIDGNGEASMKYTRDGTFKITKDGFIVDSNGNRLQGRGGDIVVPPGTVNIAINELGDIFADGAPVDQLNIVNFENYDYLRKFGDNMYEPVEGAVQINTIGLVLQGYTEQSNVNVVSEMVDMIGITRAYEANQKVIQTMDTMLNRSVNEVGKV